MNYLENWIDDNIDQIYLDFQKSKLAESIKVNTIIKDPSEQI